jgi:hypothetical protein
MPVKFTCKYNVTQFVHTHTVIPKSAVKKEISVKQEKIYADDEKGELFSMEDMSNSKDFHQIGSITLTSRNETPE